VFIDSLAQKLPFVYNVENTGADYPIPYLPSISELPAIQALPDPFEWADGRGRISNFSDWRYRRAEISAQIQNYEIGPKPAVDSQNVTAGYTNGILTVNITVNGNTLTLTSQVILPSGSGPFPAVIGMNSPSGSIPSNIFSSRNIATIAYMHDQVTTYNSPNNTNPFYRLYPTLNIDNTGQYVAWAWGVSRIIDGLKLVQNVLPIDLKHIAVTGCSYAGKMALFAGAFDERVALTIAQESGGGGATSWRYSGSEPTGSVEGLAQTSSQWFANSMFQFGGINVSKLPEDHHELMAMCAPRALYVTGNPDYTWLSNPSCDVCSRACQQVYNTLGIADRFGFSIVGGHMHCQVPSSQTPEIEAFVDKFLLGKDSVNTNISDSPYSTNLSPWITWTNPTLMNGTSYFGKTSLISPPNLQKDMDTSVTFRWNKAADAEEYFIQLSNDITFADNARIDSTTDTVKTITGLLKSKRYYWRVQIKSANGPGPWSEVWQITTAGPLPAKPELIAATQDSVGLGYLGFKFNWKKVEYADQYVMQISNDSTFVNINSSTSTSDTVKKLFGFLQGQKYYWRIQASNVLGSGPWSDVSIFPQSETDVKAEGGIPTEYSISQNYPNPFNPSTKIIFALPQRALTKLIIYDLLGREVQTLINKELEAGYHEIYFDATNFPSGVYFYRIQSGNFIQTKKMILMK
jgi:Fibronectin type III domain.